MMSFMIGEGLEIQTLPHRERCGCSSISGTIKVKLPNLKLNKCKILACKVRLLHKPKVQHQSLINNLTKQMAWSYC